MHEAYDKQQLAAAIKNDLPEGLLQVARSAYRDPGLFDLEMRELFEKSWVYLAHESQLSGRGAFITTSLGLLPILVCRDDDQKIRAFINSCTHRGSLVCREAKGVTSFHTCPFHGWTFDTKGDLIGIPYERTGGYPEQFRKESFGLKALPRLSMYRGLIFGSMVEEGASLEDWLGDAKVFIDLLCDQSKEGEIEVLPGVSSYQYKGNWKLQCENQSDGYHVYATHGSYLETLRRRKVSAQPDQIRAMDFTGFSGADIEGGFFALENGHAVLWWDWSGQGADNKPNAERYPQYLEQWGQVKADWMLGRARNLIIYPNLLLTDHASTQIRVIKPLAWDQTEVSIYCFGLKGESLTERGRRLRQYEDFFNASGMATPDDVAVFEFCHEGYASSDYIPWNDLSRGAKNLQKGANQRARELGITPKWSGGNVEDEQIMWAYAEFWQSKLMAAIAGRLDGVPRSTLDLESGTTTVSGVERERAREGATSPSS